MAYLCRKKLEDGSNIKDENGPPSLFNPKSERRHFHTHSHSISFSSSIMGTPVSPYLSTSIHVNILNENTMEISRNMEKSDWKSYNTKETLVSLSRRLFSSKKKQMTLAILSAIFSGAAMPLFLFFLFEVCIAYIDEDQTSRDKRIQSVLLLLVLLAIITFFSNLLQHLNFAKAGEFLVKDVMEKMFQGQKF